VTLAASGNNTVVLIDTDGSAGPALPRPLLTLLNVSPANLDLVRDLGLGSPAVVANAIKASRSAALRASKTK